MPERDETRGNLTAALLCIYQVQFCKELSFSLVVATAAHDIISDIRENQQPHTAR